MVGWLGRWACLAAAGGGLGDDCVSAARPSLFLEPRTACRKTTMLKGLDALCMLGSI